MNRLHCPNCYSTKIIKKGKRVRRQQYYCKNCHIYWVQPRKKSQSLAKEIWKSYADDCLTKNQLAKLYKTSRKNIDKIIREYQIPPLKLSHVFLKSVRTIIMDVTYLESRQHGILVVIDADSGRTLYRKELFWVEKIADYEEALITLILKLPALTCCVIDGRKGVREMILKHKLLVQHCQFHQIKFMLQKLTRNPKTDAGKVLKCIALMITKSNKRQIRRKLNNWKKHYGYLLKERTFYLDGHQRRHWHYTHRNLRAAFNSLERNLDHLYTFYDHPDAKIPNTANKIDGKFGVIKNKIRTHRGCSAQGLKKIWDYFLS